MRFFFSGLLYLAAAAALFSVASCSREQKAQDAVALVNGEPILLNELREELSRPAQLRSSGDITQSELEARLDAMIDNKLMAQEAVKLGIENGEQYRQKLKVFREQTLVSEVIAAKTKEWSQTLTVSDEEIKALYSRMRYKVYIREAHRADRQKAERVLSMMRKGWRVKGMKKSGPLFVERVGMTDPLYKVFDMKTGEAAIWPEPDGYRIVMVTRKKLLGLPPLKSVTAETKNYIFEKKKVLASEAWLAALKKGSRVEVNTDELMKVKRLD